jgi:hypothetical protein
MAAERSYPKTALFEAFPEMKALSHATNEFIENTEAQLRQWELSKILMGCPEVDPPAGSTSKSMTVPSPVVLTTLLATRPSPSPSKIHTIIGIVRPRNRKQRDTKSKNHLVQNLPRPSNR